MTRLPASAPHSMDAALPNYRQAWEVVKGQLRADMSRADFETWVEPLRPLNYAGRTFTLAAYSTFARDWVESRLKGRISRLLEGLFAESVTLKVVVANGFQRMEQPDYPAAPPPAREKEKANPAAETDQPTPAEPSTRKVMLQRAYGSERARLIQPERGMFVTLYLFNEWLPLLGHSAFATILAARSLCYWNPMTGELRNTIDTEMAELAKRAAVSVRTVKDVLANELVRRYFLRYRVRRMMTPNGVRTAGISLQVRMDDPLTPADQAESHLVEEERWYTLDFAAEEEEE
jgi:hypothetical protein